MFTLFKILSISSMLVSLLSCGFYKHTLQSENLLEDQKSIVSKDGDKFSMTTSFRKEESEPGSSIKMPSYSYVKLERRGHSGMDDLLNNQIRKINGLTKERESDIVAYESEATSVMKKVNNRLEAIKTMHSELSASILKIESMQFDITSANSDFENARRFSGNGIDVSLKIELGKAIDKLKSSSSIAMTLYKDVFNILEHANNSVEYARGLADSALSEARSLRLSDYYDGIRYYYISDAKKSLSHSDNMFKKGEEKLDSFRVSMQQVNDDYAALNKSRQALLGIKGR